MVSFCAEQVLCTIKGGGCEEWRGPEQGVCSILVCIFIHVISIRMFFPSKSLYKDGAMHETKYL